MLHFSSFFSTLLSCVFFMSYSLFLVCDNVLYMFPTDRLWVFSSFLFCYSSPQQHCTLVYFYFDRKVSSILEHRSLADSLSSLATRSLSQSISISFTGSSVPLPSPCFLEGFRPGPRRFLPGPATCSFLSLSLAAPPSWQFPEFPDRQYWQNSN